MTLFGNILIVKAKMYETKYWSLRSSHYSRTIDKKRKICQQNWLYSYKFIFEGMLLKRLVSEVSETSRAGEDMTRWMAQTSQVTRATCKHEIRKLLSSFFFLVTLRDWFGVTWFHELGHLFGSDRSLWSADVVGGWVCPSVCIML